MTDYKFYNLERYGSKQATSNTKITSGALIDSKSMKRERRGSRGVGGGRDRQAGRQTKQREEREGQRQRQTDRDREKREKETQRERNVTVPWTKLI